MEETRRFRLALFGFSETERRVLGSMVRLAAGRGRRYEIADEGERGEADIGMVDMDQPDAVADWRQAGSPPPLPSVLVSQDPPETPPDDEIYVRRPFTVKRLLDGLERVVLRSYQYVPELTIADDEEGGAELEGEAYAKATQAAARVRSSGFRALVVDDSQSVRKLMGIQLGLYGVETDFAASGEEALDRLQEEDHYDIVFLDLVLPEMDGYTVCKAIRRDRAYRDVPVIMLTGRGSRFDRIRGAMAGCSVYLTKPVGQEALQEVIERYLTKETNHVGEQGIGG